MAGYAGENYESAAHAADTLAETIEETRFDFAPVIADLLLQKTFDLSRKGNSSAADLKEIVASFVKLRELELKTGRQLAASSRARPPRAHHHQVDLNIVPPGPTVPTSDPAHLSPALQIEVRPRARTRPHRITPQADQLS